MVWVQNFVWNFKGHLWNFTQNFEPMHRKICILRSSVFFVWVTISLNCDVISLSETGPRIPINQVWLIFHTVSCNFKVTPLRRLFGFLSLISEFALILHWIILFSLTWYRFYFTSECQHLCACATWKHRSSGQNAQHCSVLLAVLLDAILPQTLYHFDAEYFQSI